MSGEYSLVVNGEYSLEWCVEMDGYQGIVIVIGWSGPLVGGWHQSYDSSWSE